MSSNCNSTNSIAHFTLTLIFINRYIMNNFVFGLFLDHCHVLAYIHNRCIILVMFVVMYVNSILMTGRVSTSSSLSLTSGRLGRRRFSSMATSSPIQGPKSPMIFQHSYQFDILLKIIISSNICLLYEDFSMAHTTSPFIDK